MDKNELKSVLGHIKASNQEKEKMLEGIYKRKKQTNIKPYLAVALVLLIVGVMAIGNLIGEREIEVGVEPGILDDEDSNFGILTTLPDDNEESKELGASGHLGISYSIDGYDYSLSVMGEGMGFSAIMVMNEEELIDGNPWQKDQLLTTLPVFIVPDSHYWGHPDFFEGDSEGRRTLVTELRDKVEEILDQKGLEIDFSIETFGDLMPRIFFERNVPMPSGMDFVKGNIYFYELFESLFGFEAPGLDIQNSYSYDGTNWPSIDVYDRSEDYKSRIIGYALSRAYFGIGHCPSGNTDNADEFGLSSIGIRVYRDLEALPNEYELIDYTEALSNIEQGYYLTNVPNEYFGPIGQEDVVQFQLIYYNTNKMLVPMYRFYRLLDTVDFDMAEGLKSYGVFYTPALREMSIDSVRFND